MNGWLQAIRGVARWTVPDIAGWAREGRDGSEGKVGGVDPFEDPAPRGDGDAGGGSAREALGADYLVYPGAGSLVGPARESAHSLGLTGVVPSIRLDNWRRGIEDAGYLQMARARDTARAGDVARWLLPEPNDASATPAHAPAAWTRRGRAYHDARRALLAIALGRTPEPLGASPSIPTAARIASSGSCGHGAGVREDGGGAAALLLVAAGGLAGAARRRARARRDQPSRKSAIAAHSLRSPSRSLASSTDV